MTKFIVSAMIISALGLFIDIPLYLSSNTTLSIWATKFCIAVLGTILIVSTSALLISILVKLVHKTFD